MAGILRELNDGVASSSSSTTAVQTAAPQITNASLFALAAPIIKEAGTTDREVASATAVPADAPKRTAAMSAEEGGDVDEDEFEAVPKRRRRRGGRS
ncbi:hypothetical protein H9P43_004817 [Blastocladiella emersonii ATCC 22665]|nr:hypothetical protein H9P43_004817 [Blastocladiella emersonii ATCC 22665]